jgi:glycosyltransferase involved in cell wall biosynthesis
MISIIIPTLNEEKTIEQTIASLNKLTDYEHEIIISDGKSKDKTIEIAKSLGAKTIIYQGTVRQTIGGGRNLGASIAGGEFLVFMDADVTLGDANKFFISALHFFAKDKNLLGLAVRQKVAPEWATLSDRIAFGLVNISYYIQNNILHTGGSGGEFQMIRADAFQKLKGFNERMPAGEDNDMFHRLAKLGHTRLAWPLVVWQTGRRGHKLGWIKLLSRWVINWFSVFIFKKSHDEIWEEVR